MALIAYSFGGLVLKSLVVEARKRVYQRLTNALDDEIQKCCKTFLNNVKGVIFYGVPHSGAANLSKYFEWQCQQINTFNKHFAQLGFSRNLKPFNLQMEYLSKDFKNAIDADLNIYAFGEGLPIDEKSVRFSFYHTKSYPLVEIFLYCQILCGIMYSTLLNILMW